METYQTAKFDRSLNNLSRDIVLTDRCTGKRGKKKRISKAKTIDLHLHADLITALGLCAISASNAQH